MVVRERDFGNKMAGHGMKESLTTSSQFGQATQCLLLICTTALPSTHNVLFHIVKQ